MRDFPEVDRGGWFALATAREKILTSQNPLLDELLRKLKRKG
jgi:predicted NUDIX family NTP pyrophosphohydrolase